MNRPLNVLALTQRRPFPPDRGDRIRSFHLLTRLAERHRVWLLATDDTPVGLGGADVADFCCEDHRIFVMSPLRRFSGAARSFVKNEPLTLGWYHHPGVERQLQEWSETIGFDVAYVFSSSMAPYWIREHARSGLPAVMDFVDVDSEKWGQYADHAAPPRSWIYRREQRRLGEYEREVARRATHSIFVSEAEVETFRSVAPGIRSEALGNGVDGGHFARPQLARRKDPPHIVFVGQMDYHANVSAVTWFADHVFPRLRRWREDLRFDVVGARPAPEVQQLGQREGIRVTGWVEDVRPYLWEASVAVAPLRIAQGTQNKVLEAMAASVPVVVSGLAARGLAESSGPHLMVADTVEETCEAVRAVLEDPDRAAGMIAAGLDFLQRHHSWEASAQQLGALLEDAAERRSVGR